MKYQVQIIEEVVETRSVEVEADSPAEAHQLAYERWVEQGEAELESTAVNSRIFHLTDEKGQEFEADGNDDPPEPA